MDLYSNGYEKVFLSSANSPDKDQCYKTLPLKNGNSISIGTNAGFSGSQAIYYLRMSDTFGDELWTRFFILGTFPTLPDLCITTDSNIVAAMMNEYDSINYVTLNTQFVKLDLQGNTLQTHSYNLIFDHMPMFGFLPKLFALPDSGCIFTTARHLIRLNLNLDTTIVKSYQTGVLQSELTPDHSQLAILRQDTLNNSDTIFITKFDLQFDSVRTYYFPIGTYKYFQYQDWATINMHYDPYGLFYFSAWNINTFDSVAFIKLDTSLNIIWKNYLVDSGVVVNEFAIDSEQVIFTGGFPNQNIETGYLYSFDTNGNINYFLPFEAMNGAYDETNPISISLFEKQIFISGHVNSDTSVQKSYIAKIDSILNLTSDELISVNKIKLYPNPATDFFNIYTNIDLPYEIRIYDINGKLKYFGKETSNKLVINVSNFVAGIYFTICYTNDEIICKKKLMIMRN